VRKYRKVSIARTSLATSWKQVPVETSKALCKPITALYEAKQTLFESSTVSTETNIASSQRVNAACKAIKVPREPRTASAKAIWIKKNPTQPQAKLERSLLIKLHAKLTQLFAEFSLAYHARLRPKHLCVLIHVKLTKLFAEFSLAYHARSRPKHLCVLIALLMQLRSHLQFLIAKLELKHYLVLIILVVRLKMKHH